MKKFSDVRPYIDLVDALIIQVKGIKEHPIVDEVKREAYLHGLLDVKMKLLDVAGVEDD